MIKELRKADFDKAREFAIEGMHLSWYTSNAFETHVYSKYFWALEVSRATRAFGAYMGDELAGVLLADIFGEPKRFPSFFRRLFVRIFEAIIKTFYKGAANAYDTANDEMLADLKKAKKLEGELNYFAVNPAITGKGIGSKLLDALAAAESGRLIYVYCDSGATHEFYRRRNFEEAGRRDIKLTISKKGEKIVDLTCFLFTKRL